MAKQFSMTTVLRQTPFPMLKWFLPYVGIDLDLDWNLLHAYDLPLVIAHYEAEPEGKRQEAEKLVQSIVILANKKGVAALHDAAKSIGLTYWLRLFPEGSSPYVQAIWAYTEHREMFDLAKDIIDN